MRIVLKIIQSTLFLEMSTSNFAVLCIHFIHAAFASEKYLLQEWDLSRI